MTANPFLGILLHAVGGLAAASFYLPFNKIKKWSWESYWLVGGLCSWIPGPQRTRETGQTDAPGSEQD
jgi:L-rhamnose-H+ transport protein